MPEYTKLGIKDLAQEDRPREKLLQKGLSALSDAELIAILLGSGSAKESAVELAKKIMASYHNNLNDLGKASIEQLQSNFFGVGEAKAVTIVAAMELGRRRSMCSLTEYPLVKSSRDIYNLLHPLLVDLAHEEFWILLLNRANKVKHRFSISKGGVTETAVDVRMILKKALDCMASYIVLCHNHPSGNIQPSSADIAITKKIAEAGKIMNIPVLDHIIIGDAGYYSFADSETM
ncbi:MAG: DNA repair protein RadC [Cytophagaceae bacterium]|jgi:DNA repair protein RadC|nr:DNA repair protein RadC [Cytophagaceae bacterium]